MNGELDNAILEQLLAGHVNDRMVDNDLVAARRCQCRFLRRACVPESVKEWPRDRVRGSGSRVMGGASSHEHLGCQASVRDILQCL